MLYIRLNLNSKKTKVVCYIATTYMSAHVHSLLSIIWQNNETTLLSHYLSDQALASLIFKVKINFERTMFSIHRQN